MKAYADSSFIVALYLPQESSEVAAGFMAQSGEALPFTPWHRLEVRNAIRLAVFQGAIDSQQGKTQLKQMEADLREETLIAHAAVDWVAVLREAEKLGAAHNERMGCRSADLFHVAAAREWGAARFLTFDASQAKMATTAGMRLGN